MSRTVETKLTVTSVNDSDQSDIVKWVASLSLAATFELSGTRTLTTTENEDFDTIAGLATVPVGYAYIYNRADSASSASVAFSGQTITLEAGKHMVVPASLETVGVGVLNDTGSCTIDYILVGV